MAGATEGILDNCKRQLNKLRELEVELKADPKSEDIDSKAFLALMGLQLRREEYQAKINSITWGEPLVARPTTTTGHHPAGIMAEPNPGALDYCKRQLKKLRELEVEMKADPKSKDPDTLTFLALLGLKLRREEYEKSINSMNRGELSTARHTTTTTGFMEGLVGFMGWE